MDGIGMARQAWRGAAGPGMDRIGAAGAALKT